MRKIILIMCLIIFPIFISAKEKINLDEYDTMNLIETIVSENLNVKINNYKEKPDQVTIYLFRGLGCRYCKNFISFLNNLDKEYYNKIKLVSFDVWGNIKNEKLLSEISMFLEGKKVNGVPYIIIGEKTFEGYAEEYNEEILKQIDKEYKKDNKIDIINKYNNTLENQFNKEEMKETLTQTVKTILFTSFVISIVI